jgi:hypothetical protein
MAVGREYSLLEIDGPRLTAVSAVVTGDRIAVRRWLVATRPETVAGDRAAAVGEWIGGEFARAQLAKSRTILAVSRGDVVLKQLTLPPSPDLSPHDLANVVRLQMVRQLTMQIEGTAIDYLPPVHRVAGSEAQNMSVMAGAMPSDRVAWCREVTQSAGLKLQRIGLRCFGAAALLADLSQRRSGAVLGIAIGAGSAEFVVVEDGQLSFARAADIPRPAQGSVDKDAFAERLAVEAKRTWMGFRGVRPGGEPELVAVIGESELSKRVGERCAAALSCAWDLVGMPSFVDVPDAMSESDRALLAPLLGLLSETLLNRPSLDFANPRKLPDRGARRRQLVLASVLGLIVAGGVGKIAADRALGKLIVERSELSAKEVDMRKELDQFLIDHARLNHFERWTSARVDWIGHLKHISQEMPAPTAGVVDDLSGRLFAATSFTMGGNYLAGKWAQNAEITFDLGGKVESRQTASDLRERLLASNDYGVESLGPDAPDHYVLSLTSAKLSPIEHAAPAPDAKGTDAKGKDVKGKDSKPKGKASGKPAAKTDVKSEPKTDAAKAGSDKSGADKPAGGVP